MLKNFSPDSFLAKHWQKRALFLPDAIDIELPSIDADELAWLAMQPEVESRLVFTERREDRTSYRVEQGPFPESDLKSLPTADWTLLVQDVEKHLPDFRQYFELVPFIPTWRLDDLMVSVAAPGGSVGPHKDNYDVFLCQGDGTRNWMISNDRSIRADPDEESLSLLMPFQPTDERDCVKGDVLYVPPGIPHWGVARTLCTTYSIGMRAPTDRELAAGLSRLSETDDERSAHNERFYCDADLKSSESLDGSISTAALRRVKEQALLDTALSDEQLVTVLGSVVTDPKAWLDPDRPTNEEVERLMNVDQEFRVHGMTLMTWHDCGDDRIAFVNGSSKYIPESAAELVRELCQHRFATADVVRAVIQDAVGENFLRWMLEAGLLDIGDNSL